MGNDKRFLFLGDVPSFPQTEAFQERDEDAQIRTHPLYVVFCEAVRQAMFTKGVRHGGAVTPFLKQPWAHYHVMHGRGFLTGQACKKLEEAASLRTGDAFVQEVLGAIVYAGMAIIKEYEDMDKNSKDIETHEDK